MKTFGMILLALACWVGGQRALVHWQTFEGPTEYMSVPPASTARMAFAGFDNMAADIYYINFIVYFGKHLHRDKAYFNLMPVLELITDLDPRFEGAYVMGAMALGDNGDFDNSAALWDKGLKANPGNWRMTYQAAMNLFMFATLPNQYARAAALFHATAQIPGSPPEARFMEARCFDGAKRLDLVIAVWRNTYLTAETDEERTVAAKTLARLRVPLPKLPNSH